MDIVLSKSTWPLVRYVCQMLGWLINGIYIVLDKIGIPNIGIAIILFALIIYVVLTPIQIKQQKVSKMMSLMQPEIDRINKKYASKKTQEAQLKQQEETMAVYDKYGISPVGSCLPTLIQMPILLSMYQVIYHIPGYIASVREVFSPLTTEIEAVSGYSDALLTFITENNIRLFSKITETISTENIYDLLYVLKPAQWTALSQNPLFSNMSSTIETVQRESTKLNMFLGFNITMAPMDIIRESMANGKYLAVIGAVMIPVLAWATQWLNTKLMPQQPSDDRNSKNNSMNSSMKTMNTMMPLMSAFFCLSLSVGIGIYWIAGAVIRSVQMIVINRYMDHIDLDELLAENQAKAAAKREKMGLPPQKITQQATKNVKQIEEAKPAPAQKKTIAQRAGTNSERPETKKVQYKSGSIAAKAGMVSQYNEAHNKKK